MAGLRSEQFTRRQLLTCACGIGAAQGRAFAFAASFWERKSPAEWSAEEIHQLLNKSPWAKQVTVEIPVRSPQQSVPATLGSNQRQGDHTGPGDFGQIRPNLADDAPNPNETYIRPRQMQKGVVRWESAKPVLDAGKAPLPALFGNRYVVSVSGFAMGNIVNVSGMPKLSDRELETIRAVSFLMTKDKKIAPARVARMMGAALWLGFSKRSFTLTTDDKEADFFTIIGRLGIKAKFNLKEMLYRGTLAI